MARSDHLVDGEGLPVANIKMYLLGGVGASSNPWTMISHSVRYYPGV